MINNFLEDEYHASDVIYIHEPSGHSLHLGDINSALDTDNIHKQQVTTVITAAAGMQQVHFDSSITHIVYPLMDTKAEDISRYFSTFCTLIERELTRGNVLVHCAAGISRSSTLVIAYLMKKKSWGFKEAIAFVRKSRPSVLPNLGFERQLKDYENALNREAEIGFQRRNGSKTSEDRKHTGRGKVLPQLIMMGRTQLKPKILDIFALQEKNRPSQQQQRPRGSTQPRSQIDLELYGTKRGGFKAKKSKSIQDHLQRPVNLSPLISNQSRQMDILKGSLPLRHLQQVMAHRLHHNTKKTATERQIRVKPLHKLAFF